MPVHHLKVSGVPNGDPAKVGGEDWDDPHALTAPVNVAADAAVLVAGSASGADETPATAYTAHRFTMDGTVLGGVRVRMKRTGTITGGNVRALLFTNASNVPSVNISDTTTGQPSIKYLATLDTSHEDVEFRLPATGLTDGTDYWVVLLFEGIAGGSVQLQRSGSGTAQWATSNDGSSWSSVNNKTAFLTVLGNAGAALSGSSDNGDGVRGESEAGFGGHFLSDIGPGSKSDSVHNFGAGGSSQYGIGVRGSSVHNHAVQGVSSGAAGGQFITTANAQPGIQSVATNGPAMQGIVNADGKTYSFLNAGAGFGEVAFGAADGSDYRLPQGAGSSYMVRGQWSETITLAGEAFKDSVADLPANAIIEAVAFRIQTTFGLATAFSLGISGDTTKFLDAVTTVTAGDSGVGMKGNTSPNVTATKLRVNTNNGATTGAIRVVVYYRQFVAPAA